jgi:aquaporin Z
LIQSLAPRVLSEFQSTFALVLAGTGAIVADAASGGMVSHSGVSLTFGLIVFAMILIHGPRSGAHMNPAVTLGLSIAGCFPKREILPYIGAQFAGALAASLVLRILAPEVDTLGATVPMIGAWRTLALEALLTYMLMFAILAMRERPLLETALAIGAVIGLEALFAGPFTGASMNPARSAGPALVSFNLHDLPIYLAGPVIGAALAALRTPPPLRS